MGDQRRDKTRGDGRGVSDVYECVCLYAFEVTETAGELIMGERGRCRAGSGEGGIVDPRECNRGVCD